MEQTGRWPTTKQKLSRPSSASSTAAAARGGSAKDNTTQQEQEEYIDVDFSEKYPSTPENNDAASVLQQKLYKNHIRRRILRDLLNSKAKTITSFIRFVKFKNILLHKRKERAEHLEQQQEASSEKERLFAITRIAKFLRTCKDRRQLLETSQNDQESPFRKLRCAQSEKERTLEKEATEGERLYSVLLVQKHVRGFFIRHYFRLMQQIHEHETEETAKKRKSELWPTGVTSYDAACSLQKYYLKHTSSSSSAKKTEEKEPEEL